MSRARVATCLLLAAALVGCAEGGASTGKAASVVPVAKVEEPKPPPPPALPCAIVADAELLDATEAFGKTVHEICVRGVADAKLKADFVSYIRLRPGAEVTPHALRREVEQLYESGYVKRVDVTARPSGRGIELDFDLELRPTVRAFAVEGATSLSPDDRALRMTRVGNVFEPAGFRRSVDELREGYIKLGYEEVKVDRDVSPDGADGVRVRVTVVEGPKSKIGVVTIKGASKNLEGEIRKFPELASGQPVTSFQLEMARARLADVYSKRGYLQSVVGLERGARAVDGAVPIAITVQEGAAYRIGKVTLSLQDPALENEMRKQLQTKPGDPVIASALLADQWRVQDALSARGKPTPLRQVTHFNEAARTVDVVFEPAPK